MAVSGQGIERGQSDEIMTLTEIAGYLKISEKTVTRMVQAGNLPGAKVANQWRFVRAVIDDWLQSRMSSVPRKDLLNVISTAPAVIPVTRLVSPGRIVLDIKEGSRQSVLARLVEPLVDTGMITDRDTFLEHLIGREEMVSTAIGRGLAIPHVREPEECGVEKPCIVLGICPDGTDFDSLDGKPTHVFAMPCANTESTHLRLLAKISLLFRKPGVLDAMKPAVNRKKVMEILAVTDSEIAEGQ
jgi:PTS system nitrogen regulatory IIA component